MRMTIDIRAIRVCILVCVIGGMPAIARAQAGAPRFEGGAQLATAVSSEFDETDVGIGGRLAWFPFGLVRFGEAPAPVVCIRIFPPPLTCQLAEGATVAAFDLGGGLEIFPSLGTFVRVDVGDRLLRYPVPAFDANMQPRTESFVSHDFRLAVGGGLRF